MYQECRYCYNQTFRTANDHKTELTLAEFSEDHSRFSDIGGESIVFTGGEPLLSPGSLSWRSGEKNWFKNQPAHKWNPLHCGECSDICKNFDLIVVSLDSKHQEEHDYLRGSHTYARTVAGIRALSNFLRENPSLETKLECPAGYQSRKY
jgi:sulfatase maturation enzyme AslB (radical SAM superfamily)